MVKLISDESVELCEEIISIQPNFIGNGAKLAREITGSNSFGNVHKTKSMLEPQHNDSTSMVVVITINHHYHLKNLKNN